MRLFKKYAVDLWNHTRKPISRNWASCGSMLYHERYIVFRCKCSRLAWPVVASNSAGRRSTRVSGNDSQGEARFDEKTRPNFPRDIRRTGYSPHRRRRVGHSSFLYGAKPVSKGLSAPRICLRSPIRRSLWTSNASMATHIICIGDANLNDLGRSITYHPIWFIEINKDDSWNRALPRSIYPQFLR
jgi:hypothetical protein